MPAFPSDGILEQSLGARKGVGIGVSYPGLPCRLHRLAESIGIGIGINPWDRFLGSLKV